ncbi:hypothetical protein [Shewanella ulleungensis]
MQHGEQADCTELVNATDAPSKDTVTRTERNLCFTPLKAQQLTNKQAYRQANLL